MPSALLSASYVSPMTSGRSYGLNGALTIADPVDSFQRAICPITGTIRHLHVVRGAADASPGIYTLYVNGVATALAATIEGGATEGENLADEVTVASGDYLTLVYAYGPVFGGTAKWTVRIGPAPSNFGLILGGGHICAAASTGYADLNRLGDFNVEAVETTVYSVAPINCTIKRLFIYQSNGAFGAGQTVTVTLRVNGADSTLAATATGHHLPGCAASDVIHEIAVNKGDLLDWKIQTAGAGNACIVGLGAVITPAVASGQEAVWISGASVSNLSAAALQYNYLLPMIHHSEWDAVSSHEMMVKASMKISGLYVRLSAAPGLAASGKQYTFTVYRNGAATALTCTVFEIATTAEDAVNEVVLAKGDLIRLTCAPANAPNVVTAAWGVVLSGVLPTVTSVTPNQGKLAATLDVAIAGTSFEGVESIDFGAGITVNSFVVDSAVQITANITIAAGAALGARDVSVTTAAGTGMLVGGFTVILGGSDCELEVSTRAATLIGGASATLNGHVDESAGAACEVWFEWAASAAYGMETPSQTGKYTGDSFSALLTGLSPGKTYHYRAVALGGHGGGVKSYGQDVVFSTLPLGHMMTLMDPTLMRTIS